MDDKALHDPAIIQQLFEQGYMGIETPAEFGGSGMSFVSSCIVIEEMAKVDPSVSLIIDIQVCCPAAAS
jgi:alkylation response protein AidB-like acyl-CoA dehydrogenase